MPYFMQCDEVRIDMIEKEYNKYKRFQIFQNNISSAPMILLRLVLES